ncbi:MAG: bactofilin family protein [Burkholderiaceae bacterium]
MFARRKKRPVIEQTKLSSLIAEDVEITGDLHFSGGIRIDGCIKGNVIARGAEGQTRALLVLSDKGRIEGGVICGDAVINGTVTGDLEVEHLLELQSNARVSGTVRYRHLQMDVGAALRGQLLKSDAPAAAANVVELGADKSAGAGPR